MPDWLATTLTGAIFAVAGYIGKMVVDQRKEKRNERARILAELRSLQSWLRASNALFSLQQDQVKRLRFMLEENHPVEFGGGGPHEEVMTRCYPVMNLEERDLHSIIRSTSEHSLRSVNQSMSKWLESATNFKSGEIVSSRSGELAEQLFLLEIHLLAWGAKYEAWIPNHPEHALVYMADEKKHGLGFPRTREETVDGKTVTVIGVEEEVKTALSELGTQWS